MYLVEHYINGKSVKRGEASAAIYNPAMGEQVGELLFADSTVIAQAVAAAAEAFPAWSATPPAKRAKILFRFRDLLEQHSQELIELVTREHGKTLADARGSFMRGVEIVEHACGITQQLQGDFSENVARNVDCYTVRQPLGICVGITPFNFPIMIPLWQMIPAIACGNTFILKPAEQDPSAPHYLARLLTEAGLPNGVVNVVNGDSGVAQQLLQHPRVRAVTAVGSTTVAETVYTQAIQRGKRAHTFGGAKNHCIVMPDANLELATKAIVEAAYGSAGERCMALPVVLAVGHADVLVDALCEQASQLTLGAGDSEGVDIGPLITRAHQQRVLSYIETGIAEEAKLRLDGRNCTVPGKEQGFFVGPCLFDEVTPSMKIYQEEIFGPVLTVLRVPDFATALELINSHRYGNGTAIFTQDGCAARTFASEVNVGMVGINIPIPVPVAYHSFGGWKQSAFGDVAMHGKQSVQFYTQQKSVTTQWPPSQLILNKKTDFKE